MGSVVVTITDGKGSERDLELPGDIPVRLLAPGVAQAIQHVDLPAREAPVKYVLKDRISGEVLPADRTLEGAGVVDGDILLLMVKPVSPMLIGNQISLGFRGPGFVAEAGRMFPFRGKTVLVGRVDRKMGITKNVLGVDLSDLDTAGSPSVSRRHAKVLQRQGEWLLEDLKSTNGSMVNMRYLEPGKRASLRDGDEVQFGDVRLAFVWDSQENAAATT